MRSSKLVCCMWWTGPVLDLPFFSQGNLGKFYSPLIFSIFIIIYSLYRGDSLCQFSIALHCTLVRLSLPSPPTNPSSPYLKQLQEVSWFYSMYVCKSHQLYFFNFISFIHPFRFHKYTSPTLYLFYSPVFSCLIPKSMFKGVS
jgi:hypothetical protein